MLIEVLKKDLGIEYGEEERNLYIDNCKRKKEEICPRLLWCGGEDKKWLKKANEGIHQCEGSS